MDGLDKGGGPRKNEFNEEWNKKIIEHIKSFPSEESHYCRRNNKDKRYLSPDLNVTRMYKLFLPGQAPNHLGKPPVSRQWYHEIFLSKFNLCFQVPKTDTCGTCDLFNLKIKAGDNVAKRDQALHHLIAEAGFAAMSADEKCSDPASYVITFDLQQQMVVYTSTNPF